MTGVATYEGHERGIAFASAPEAEAWLTRPVLARSNPSGIAPLDHRVLILADEPEEKTKGGIILPGSELDKQKYAATRATVVAIGAMAWAEAKHDAKQFGLAAAFPQPGDRVLVGRYTGDRHKGADGKDYTVINDADVIGLLTEE